LLIAYHPSERDAHESSVLVRINEESADAGSELLIAAVQRESRAPFSALFPV